MLTCVPDIQANTFDIESNKYPCKRPWSLDEYYLHKSFIIFTCVCFGFLSFLIILYVTSKSSVVCTLLRQFARKLQPVKQRDMKRSSWHAFLSGLPLSLLFARFHLLLFFSILFPPTTQLSSINMKRCIYCIEYLGFCFLQIRFLIRFYTHYKAATIATTLGFSLNPRYAVVNHSKVMPFKKPAIGRELPEPFPLITVNEP